MRKAFKALLRTLVAWCAASASFGLLALSANAQTPPPPSIRFGDASAVTPSAAWTYFSGVGLSSPSRVADPLVTRTAHALGNDALRIFAFVYNEMEVVPLFGVQKGARGCLIDKACTPFDQAHLLAELLRAADANSTSVSFTVSYRFGQATLTLPQMRQWLGVPTAAALSEVLADGGIPYTVSGSGESAEYTILHMWVRLVSGSNTYDLDPSFKTYTDHAGLSTTTLDNAMGFAPASLMSSALSGSSSSTSGAPQVAAFNRGNLRSALQSYSASLLTYIVSNHEDDRTIEVIGGREIVAWSGGLPSAPSYTLGTVRATFSNDAPLALRTQTTVTAGTTADVWNWALDEIYGEELALIPMEFFPAQGSSDPITYRFYRNGVAIGPERTGVAAAVGVAFNHPYAADSGAYADRTLSGGGQFHAGAIQFIVGGGVMSPDFGAYMEARASSIEGFVEYSVPGLEPDPNIRVNGQRATKRRYATSLAAQFAAALSMTAEIGDASIAVHDLLITAHTVPMVGGLSASPMTTIGSLSVEGTISATADSASASETLAVRRASVSLLAVLEASAVEQNLDSVYPISTASRFDWFSGSSEHSSTNRRFYWANSSNWTYVSGQIQNDDFYNGSQSRALAEEYVDAGYTVIVPRSSYLGPGDDEALICVPGHVPAPGQPSDPPCQFPGAERGVAIIAISPTGVAHVVVAQDATLKGGGGTDDAEVAPTRIFSIPEDFLERQFTARAEAYNVDLATGAVTYTPPPDLVVGEGAYPYALAFQRSFRSGGGYDRYSAAEPAAILDYQEQFENSGWTSNWMHEARMQNDGQRAFGSMSPREATDTIAAIRVLLALSGDQASDIATLEYQLGAIHAMAWWGEQLSYNVVQIVQGADNRSFFQLADGSFQGPPGDPTVIELFGARAIYEPPLSATHRWVYNGMCVRASHRDGSTSFYGSWNSGFTACDTSASGPTNLRATRWMRFRRQSFREGVIVSFDDHTLSNNLGRSITLTEVSQTPPVLEYTVRDDEATSRTVSITLDLSENVDQSTGPGVMSVTGTDGETWIYDGSTDASWAIFAPSSDDDPIVTFNYLWCASTSCAHGARVRGQVETLTAAVGNDNDYADAQYWISSGRIGAMVDPAGFATRTFYDNRGLPVRVTNRLGYDTTTAYDAFRRVVRATQPEGNAEEYEYNAAHDRILTRLVPKPGSGLDPIETHATYDATCGVPLTETDALGNVTTYTLDDCLVETITQPAVDDGTTPTFDPDEDQPVTTYTWNAYGQLLSRVDPTGREVRYGYDGDNYLETVTVENGASDIVTTFDRNAAGDITSVTDPLSRVHTGTYDASRRLTRYDGPSGTGAATEWRYNQDGLVDRIRQATGNAAPNDWSTTTYTYWRAGRVETMTDPDGGVTTYIYDDLNRPFAVIDPEERRSETIYDAEGQVLEEHRGVGSALEQIYATRAWTANGLLDWVQDANDNRSNLDYDGFDRLRRLYFPVTTLGAETPSTTDYEEYGYDENDNRVEVRLRSSESIYFEYDALNREIFKNIPGGTDADVTSRYDLAGRRTFARFGSSLTPSSDCTATGNTGIDYCYDAVGRLQYETSYGRRLAFTYDAASNRTRITFPDSNYSQYDYDALNRVTHVRENGASSGAGVLAAYSYDAMSRRLTLDRGNGVNTEYGYTDASRLASLAHDLSGTTNDANWAFQYTDAGQVSSRTWIQAYEWPVAALDEDYEANGLNQYSEVDSAAFNYDSRGNLVSDGARNFSYDYENRLASASGAVSGTLAYDPLGRLRSYTTGGTTTEFLYDGDRLVAEYVSGNIARRYAHGPGVDEPLVWYEGSGLTDRRWLIADRQGSIVATTDASGAGTVYRYGPYGEPESWTGPRFRYTGQAVLSELQLYHYKARVYDPNLGRFLQTDPVGYEDDLNLYAYGRNDPLNSTDPTGRWPAPTPGDILLSRAVGDFIDRTITQPSLEFGRSVGDIATGNADRHDWETVTIYAATMAVPELAAERAAAGVAVRTPRAAAVTVRDLGLPSVRGTPGAAVGAVDEVTLRATFATSGPVPPIIAPGLAERASAIGGVGSRGPAGTTIGCCAEFRAVNELALAGSNIDDVVLSPAVRPRRQTPVPRCENCEAMFGPE